jgi:hypothetical protein
MSFISYLFEWWGYFAWATVIIGLVVGFGIILNTWR